MIEASYATRTLGKDFKKDNDYIIDMIINKFYVPNYCLSFSNESDTNFCSLNIIANIIVDKNNLRTSDM